MLTNFNVLVLKFRVILVFLIYNILEKKFQMKLFVNYVFNIGSIQDMLYIIWTMW